MTIHSKVDTPGHLELPTGIPISRANDDCPGCYSRIALVLSENCFTRNDEATDAEQEHSTSRTQTPANQLNWAGYEAKGVTFFVDDREDEMRAYTHEDEERYNGRTGFYIRFEPAITRGKLCDDATKLYSRVKRAERYLNNLEITANQRRDYVLWLVRIARFGLQGENCCPRDALRKMDIFEHEMKGPLKEHRNAYIEGALKHHARALIISIVALLTVAALDYVPQTHDFFASVLGQFHWVTAVKVKAFVYAYVIGMLGLVVGETFTVVAQGRVPQYAGFFDNQRYRYCVRERGVFVLTVWTIVVSLAAGGVINIPFENFTFGAVLESPHQAALLAVLTSIGFQQMTDRLMSSSKNENT